MIRAVASIIVPLALSPVSAAGSGTVWASDLDMLQSVLVHSLEDETQQETDMAAAEKPEFFPNPDGQSAGTADASPYVSFLWNGVQTELTDVPRQTWFAPYVRDVANRGIVSGYTDAQGRPTGKFMPDRSVTIEELAKMALTAAGIESTQCSQNLRNPFAKGRWSAHFVSCAEQKSFSVFSDGTVDVKRPATRGEVVVSVLEAFSVRPRTLTSTGTLFSDVLASTPYASAIETAASDEIISGYDGLSGEDKSIFLPEKTINRAEMAKVISKALQKYAVPAQTR